MKRAILFACAFAVATAALAQLSKYKDWAKSPEAFFLTPSERTEWGSVKTDADAEKFIAAYYARRGGDRFKDEIARRIAAADQQFKLRRQRGAESWRGRLLIVLGGPSRVSTARAQEQQGIADPNARPDTTAGILGGGAAPGAVTQNWYYLKDRFDPSWGVPELVARVSVDPSRGVDDLQNRGEVEHVLAIAAEKSVVNPGATAAPAAGAAPPATGAPPASAPGAGASGAGTSGAVKPAVPPAATGASAAAPPPPPAAAMAAVPPATKALLETVGKTKAEPAGFFGGVFHSIPGDSFYAIELAAPGDKVPAGTAKFAGVVTNEAGQEVASFWEDATLTDAKNGAKTDKVYERSVVLPPGSYKGTFALVTPDGTTALASGTASFQLAGKGTDFEVSPLILASVLTPLTKRPAPTDPFVFGSDKPIRVDPKASHLFTREESLWYFYTVTNPVLPASAASAAPATTPAPGAPAAPAAPEPKPRIMTRVSVLRDGQPAFQPATLPAELQPLSPGYFATGSEIPLASFEPGYYTFAINVRDLNAPRDSAANKGVDRRQDFVVLKPDGSLPEKKAAPVPVTKPKPTKK